MKKVILTLLCLAIVVFSAISAFATKFQDVTGDGQLEKITIDNITQGSAGTFYTFTIFNKEGDEIFKQDFHKLDENYYLGDFSKKFKGLEIMTLSSDAFGDTDNCYVDWNCYDQMAKRYRIYSEVVIDNNFDLNNYQSVVKKLGDISGEKTEYFSVIDKIYQFGRAIKTQNIPLMEKLAGSKIDSSLLEVFKKLSQYDFVLGIEDLPGTLYGDYYYQFHRVEHNYHNCYNYRRLSYVVGYQKTNSDYPKKSNRIFSFYISNDKDHLFPQNLPQFLDVKWGIVED